MIAVAMGRYLTLAGRVHVEPDPIKRSRFIGDAGSAATADAAMAFVAEIREQHAGAGHHCFAYRLGPGDQGFRVSDDGEPGGTAGQPILNHIDGAQLNHVVFVVTRYFGGTKLGKGGLIRAYGGTAGHAIAAAKIVEVQRTQTLTIRCSYADQGTVEGVLRGLNTAPSGIEFGADVCIHVAVPVDDVATAQALIIEATAGRSRPE